MARRSRFRIPSQELVARALLLVRADTPWQHEGPARHLIRSDLCLQGCPWKRADEIARRLVARARSLTNGTPAPRGYDDTDLSSWTETEQCPICDKWFQPARGRVRQQYCSVRCRARAGYLRRRQGIDPVVNLRCGHCNDVLIDPKPCQKFCSASCKSIAVKHRKIADRLLDRTCLECSAPIPDDANARVKFCGLACTRRHNNRRTSERRSEARAAARPTWSTLTCQVCGRAFTVTRRTDAKYCSATCNTAAYRARQLNGPAKLNGHCHETHRPLADHRPDLAAGRERDCSDQDASQPVAV